MGPRGHPPYRYAGAVLLALVIALGWAGYGQFRGAFTAHTRVVLRAERAGLVMDPGAKVTFNGVEIGRVSAVDAEELDGVVMARLALDLTPKFAAMLPANVIADISATTLFGNKYVSFRSPEYPSAQRLSSSDVIVVGTVSTEFNTIFETVLSISEKVDPVRLNATLAATAEALTGQGHRFGAAVVSADRILDEVLPRMPALRRDVARLGALAEIYTAASPDLWSALDAAERTAVTLDDQRADLDTALLAAVGFGNTGADVFGRADPYLRRGADDLRTTSATLADNSPALYCTLRNYAGVAPRVAAALGANGYSLGSLGGGGIIGAENPYVYPDNLPRVNARGGPGGAPGCWQPITRELWPAPYLVMDTGASIAPYNHLELGQPLLTDYVWGRQVGANTINP